MRNQVEIATPETAARRKGPGKSAIEDIVKRGGGSLATGGQYKYDTECQLSETQDEAHDYCPYKITVRTPTALSGRGYYLQNPLLRPGRN